MAETTYSGWSSGWKPKGSSVYKYYRVRLDTSLNTYPTYCTISFTMYLEINSTVGHNGYHWYTSTGGSGSVNTVYNGAKLVTCGSGTTGAVYRTHTNGSISVSGSIYTSSSGGTSPWNNGTVTATASYTVPPKASYAIEYDANEGTGELADTKWFGETLTLSTGTNFSRENYTLLRWDTQADGQGTSYDLGGAYTTDAPLELYAIWQGNPTCTTTVSSTTPYYTGKASYSVNITNASASGGASITSIVLQLGSQTAERADNGALSITPSISGTFTPTVTITDSLGAARTYTLSAITVKQYVPPLVTFTIERTQQTGVADETEGMSCVIEANFAFCDDGYNLVAPTVTYVITDATTTPTTATVTWYTTRNVDGTVSDPVVWNNISSGQPIYGLISNVFSTNASYTIAIVPRDSRTSGDVKTQILSVALYPIDFFAGGNGVAIGRAANSEGFFCAMDAVFEANIALEIDDDTSGTVDDRLSQAFARRGWIHLLHDN